MVKTLATMTALSSLTAIDRACAVDCPAPESKPAPTAAMPADAKVTIRHSAETRSMARLEVQGHQRPGTGE